MYNIFTNIFVVNFRKIKFNQNLNDFLNVNFKYEKTIFNQIQD